MIDFLLASALPLGLLIAATIVAVRVGLLRR
jgi:hypothetical protein